MSAKTCSCTCGLPGCHSVHTCDSNYNERRKKYNKKTNDKSRDKASEAYKRWTEAEIEIATNMNLSARQAAARLGRSICAIRTVRSQKRRDEKEV